MDVLGNNNGFFLEFRLNCVCFRIIVLRKNGQQSAFVRVPLLVLSLSLRDLGSLAPVCIDPYHFFHINLFRPLFFPLQLLL